MSLGQIQRRERGKQLPLPYMGKWGRAVWDNGNIWFPQGRPKGGKTEAASLEPVWPTSWMPVVLLGATAPAGSFWECKTNFPIASEGLAGTPPLISLLLRLAHRLNTGSGTWDHTLPHFQPLSMA